MRYAAIVAGCLHAYAHVAVADRYEAGFTIRPIGAVGRVTETVRDAGAGTAVVTSVYGGGGEVGLTYGLRNWLDVGAELVGEGFAQAMFDSVTVVVAGNTSVGRLLRTTRLVQLRGGATLRLGVGWVPTLHVGLGAGGRALDAARLREADHTRTFEVTPDGKSASFAIDIVATVRVGLEHRLDRRWSAGLSAEAMHATGLGTPALEVVSAGISLTYTWYPIL